MSISLFFGSSLIAAFIAGMIALFAPCCISFMLPAYFAGAVKSKRGLIAMTFVFAAGVATIVLPITLGASFLWGLFLSQHKTIYIVGGIMLLGMAIFTFIGGKLHIPIPALSSNTNTPGMKSAYLLGVFSGITSSCCAPVLAGVIAVSSVASSFGMAIIYGVIYVFGMVAPLFVISLLWESYDWSKLSLFRSRTIHLTLKSYQYTIAFTDFAAAIVIFLLGILMIWVGFTFTGMQKYSNWQIQLLLDLQRTGIALTHITKWIPNWIIGIIFLIVLTFLAKRGIQEAKKHDIKMQQTHPEGE